MNEKLEKLNQEIEKTEKKLRRAQHEEKMLEHQIKTLTRKERTHRLCTRAAMLESYLPHPEAITDEQVSLFLKHRSTQPMALMVRGSLFKLLGQMPIQSKRTLVRLL
jgi:predicted nuclease with TOPRIM domain